MAPRSATEKPSEELVKRIVTGVVLGPPVLIALYVGPPYSDVVIAVAACAMGWEWARLCGAANTSLVTQIVVGSVGAASIAAALDLAAISGWLIAVGTLAVALAAKRSDLDASWLALGVLTVGLSCLALIWLRNDPVTGRVIVLWLVAAVWATDIGAFIAGRTLGGPKLAPRISPKKTWSGLGGGMVAAAFVGYVTSFFVDEHNPGALVAGSALLGVVAQAGDLFESMLKRRFGAKDSSQLIPGHGGVLDRADGLMAASLGVAAVIWITRGL